MDRWLLARPGGAPFPEPDLTGGPYLPKLGVTGEVPRRGAAHAITRPERPTPVEPILHLGPFRPASDGLRLRRGRRWWLLRDGSRPPPALRPLRSATRGRRGAHQPLDRQRP